MSPFVHDSIQATIDDVASSRKKPKGASAEPQLRAYVHLEVTDPLHFDAILSDLLDIEVGDVEAWREENGERFHTINFKQRYVKRKVNFRISTDMLASMPEAIADGFVLKLTEKSYGLKFRISAISNGAQVGVLSELQGAQVRLEVVSLQGELDLQAEEPPPKTTRRRAPQLKEGPTETARA